MGFSQKFSRWNLTEKLPDDILGHGGRSDSPVAQLHLTPLLTLPTKVGHLVKLCGKWGCVFFYLKGEDTCLPILPGMIFGF